MPRITGTVTIYQTYFKLDDVVDGDYPRDNVWTEVHENVTASEAARILDFEGLSFAATGNDWAAMPDGSYTTNYGTGEQCETSGHLDGFPDRLVDAIVRKVG